MDILFAKDSKRITTSLKEETIKDLALGEIIDSVSQNDRDAAMIRAIFTKIPADIRDSAFRQEILRDFLENEELTTEVTESLGMIRTLKDYGSMALSANGENQIYTLLQNLRELSTYVSVSEGLVKALQKYPIRSEGLMGLKEQLEKVVEDESFAESKQDIENMLEDLSTVKGALVGVNFTSDLDVESVAAIEFVPYRLRSKYKFAEVAASIGNIMSFGTTTNSLRVSPHNTRVIDPMLVNMTPLMEKYLKNHLFRIRSFLKKYVDLDGSFITEMYEGLTFYTAMARFGKRLQDDGWQICFPKLATESPTKEGRTREAVQETAKETVKVSDGITFRIRALYNIRLVLSGEKNIVKNDFSFSPKENIFILTGPNRGGKTILEQALGILSVMASVGSFVTASSCEGRPFSDILTHFPIDENLTINYGRLGEEAVRIRGIVGQADAKTLLLFNETYSTTSAVDGLYLSKDLLRILKKMGVPVIFNTHIHEVARSVEEMNEWEGQSNVVGLVMEIKDGQNTFKIKRSAPDSRSYAENIAKKYGITYSQMEELLQDKKD